MKLLAYQVYKNLSLNPEDDLDIAGYFFKLQNIETIKCHLMGREFSEKLMNVNLDIKVQYLYNLKERLYVEFPEDIQAGKDVVSGCIFIPLNEKGFMWICLFRTKSDEVQSLNIGFERKIIENDSNLTVSQFLEKSEAPHKSKHDRCGFYEKTPELIRIIKYCVNCILYCNSGNPDLRELRPVKFRGKSKKALKKFRREYPVDFTIVYVGYDYKKHLLYSVDGCPVVGHFRWQPCGPKLCTVKLIWIKEHERHFKNILNVRESNNDPTNQPADK